jgi:hypothetical protein
MRKEPEKLFEKKDAALFPLFKILNSRICKWRDVSASATQNCIVYVANGSFLIVKPMKNAIDLKFPLNESVDVFPVYKVVPWGKKVWHHIRLFDKDDLDAAVWSLLQQAYHEDFHRSAP